jgi:hypothetical protein
MTLKRKPPAGNVRRARSHGRNQPGIVVTKAGRTAQYETQPEYILTLILERDPTVAEYDSQPEAFGYTDAAGRPAICVPDYMVRRVDGSTELHLVRSAYLPERPVPTDVRLQEEALRDACQKRGWHLVTHTERTLPGPTERANLRILSCYRALGYADHGVEREAIERLKGGSSALLRALAAETATLLDKPLPSVTAALCHMLWAGKLRTDMARLLFFDAGPAPRATVWLPDASVPSKETGTRSA